MEDNCFTIVCWPLPYNNVSQPQLCSFPPEPPPPPIPPLKVVTTLHSLWSQQPPTGYFWYPVVYTCYISQCYSLRLSYRLLPLLLEKWYWWTFGHLMWRADSLEKTLMLGKNEGRRRRGCQKMRWLDSITDSVDMCSSKLQGWRTGKPGVQQSMGSQRVGHDWAIEKQPQLINLLQGRNKEADIETRLRKL